MRKQRDGKQIKHRDLRPHETGSESPESRDSHGVEVRLRRAAELINQFPDQIRTLSFGKPLSEL